MGYGYISLAQLRAELLNRLQDTSAEFTTSAEADIYIRESLRALNAKTVTWPDDYQLDFAPGDTWKSLNVPGSPRERTITDIDLYNQMEAMLLEPMGDGNWIGTDQYNLAMFQGALQFRRDELLLECAANVANLFEFSPVLGTTTILPDSTLDLLRVRWVAVDGVTAYALGREDVVTANAFKPLRQTEPGEPDSWMITANTPPSFDCSCPLNQPGQWDMLVSFAGAELAPPTATVLGLPDDWCWVALYGALADVLANAPEGRDAQRAKYCLQVYEQGKRAMRELPWLLSGSVGSINADTPGFGEMDTQQQNWELTQNETDQTIVVGGVDLVAMAPFNVTSAVVSTVLTLVGNAPVPLVDADMVQLSKDGVDAVLARAQHVATFKRGGEDFLATIPLLEQFEAYCRTKNSQYAALGIFRPDLLMSGNEQDEGDPRFERETTNA